MPILKKSVLLHKFSIEGKIWKSFLQTRKSSWEPINIGFILLVIKNFIIIEKIKKFVLINEEFTIENGMLTPTLKLKRKEIIKNYKQQLENLYLKLNYF